VRAAAFRSGRARGRVSLRRSFPGCGIGPVLVLGLLVPALAGSASPARAEVEVRASVDRQRLSLDEQLVLRVEVSGSFRSGGEPQLPPLDDWSVATAGQSSQISIVNGNVTSTRIYSYVLVPRRAGTRTIGPVRVGVGGEEYASRPITVEVTEPGSRGREPGGGGGSPGGGGRQGGGPGEDQGTVQGKVSGRGDPVFVAARVDRDTVFVGEPVTWTFSFFRRVPILGNPEYRRPAAANFWVEDLPPQRTFYRSLDGYRYHVTEVKQSCFPTAAGEQTIGSAQLGVIVDDLFGRDLSRFFRRGLSGFGDRIELETDPIDVVVLPLPERGRPAGFEGTVGEDLELKATLDEREVAVGDPVTLRVTVRGKGNLRTVTAPRLPEIPGVSSYTSGSSTDLSKEGYEVRGTKTYEFVLVPRGEGTVDIPSLEYAYFDSRQREYVTLSTAPLRVRALAAEGEPSPLVVGGQEDIRVVGQDIRHIKTAPAALGRPGPPAYASPFFLALQPLPILVLLGGVLHRRRQRRLAADRGLARLARAGRAARKNLSRARRLREGDLEAYLAALSRTLREYLADKLDLPAAGLTLERVRDGLAARGVGGEGIDRTLEALERLDRARFAPGAGTLEERDQLYGEVREIVAELAEVRTAAAGRGGDS
jgi:hypothetical protein